MADREFTPNTGDGRLERAKDQALGKHDDNPGVVDHVGEAAGGISGTVAGAAVGSMVGPIGTIVGGIVGAMGGWWSGRAVAEAATAISKDDDDYYRRRFETSGLVGGPTYEEVQPAYYLGHLASRNPDYINRSFESIEGDLSRGWMADNRYGAWDDVRDFAREGYARGRSTFGKAAEGLADRVDDFKDRVDMNPVSRPGPDPTDRPERFF